MTGTTSHRHCLSLAHPYQYNLPATMVVSQRQAFGDTAGNGVFILTSPDTSPGEPSGHHHRSRRDEGSWSGSFGSFLAFLFAAISLLAGLAHVLNSSSSRVVQQAGSSQLYDDGASVSNEHPSNTTASDYASLFDDEGPRTTQQQQQPSGRATTARPPRIPRRLIFAHKHDLVASADSNSRRRFAYQDPRRNASSSSHVLLSPRVEVLPFDADEPLANNVMKTIDMYQDYWKKATEEEEEPSSSRVGEETEEQDEAGGGTVSFLSHHECLGVIKKAEPRLVRHFLAETEEEYKTDVCRAAALYLHGGYYHDVDVGIVEPVDLDSLGIPEPMPDPLWQFRALNRRNVLSTPTRADIVTFATVYSGHGGEFFQGFVAATPRHPVLKRSLDYTVAYYEGTLEELLPRSILDLHAAGNAEVPSRSHPGEMNAGSYILSVAHRSTTDGEWEDHVTDLMRDTGYSGMGETVRSSITPPKRRHSRFLYEISLDDKEVMRSGVFRDVPRQVAEPQSWCNHVSFGGPKAFFYSSVPGSELCPMQENRVFE